MCWYEEDICGGEDELSRRRPAMNPKRGAALAVALILAVVPTALPARAGAAAPEVWTGDRTITYAAEFGENASLEIAAGANLTFDVPSSLPPDLENNTPSLSVEGGLLINGTAECRTAFCATERVREDFEYRAYLYIVGNGMPAQFVVRNCTFRNILVYIENADGEFTDCAFNNSSLRMYDSGGVVRNCTFRDSPLVVVTGTSHNVTVVSGCDFSWNLSRLKDADAAIYGRGNVRIEYCSFSDFFWPIYSTDGSLDVSGCRITGATGYAGIFIGDHPGGLRPAIPVIRDTVVENCARSCIFTHDAAIISNCTLTGSEYGLEAPWYGYGEDFNVTLEGNRIFNNSKYGVSCAPILGQNVSVPQNNTYDDGQGLTNGRGRMECRTVFYAYAEDQWGSRLVDVSVCWTDALGESGGDNISGKTGMYCTDYHFDNAGIRREHFPVALTAEKDGITCQTVVNGPGETVRLVLQIPPTVDIAVMGITPEPKRPISGEYVRFNVSVACFGADVLARAGLYVNGEEVTFQNLGTIHANSSRSIMVGGISLRNGRYRVEVRLDPRNEVYETNEGNNNMSLDLVVAPPPSPHSAFNAPLAVFSALILLLLVAVVLSALKGRMRKPNPPNNDGK